MGEEGERKEEVENESKEGKIKEKKKKTWGNKKHRLALKKVLGMLACSKIIMGIKFLSHHSWH